jgi:hypothetical protein
MHIYPSGMCIPTGGSGDTNTFFTIGHSTRTIVEFADLLQESGVDLVIDVRSMPRSRTNPQFNQQSLPEALAPWQIGYEHIAGLGGLRESRAALNPRPILIGACAAFETMRTTPSQPPSRPALPGSGIEVVSTGA